MTRAYSRPSSSAISEAEMTFVSAATVVLGGVVWWCGEWVVVGGDRMVVK